MIKYKSVKHGKWEYIDYIGHKHIDDCLIFTFDSGNIFMIKKENGNMWSRCDKCASLRNQATEWESSEFYFKRMT